MKKFTEKQMQEFCYILALEEYKSLVDYCQTKDYEIARQCGVDNINDTVCFIQRLLLKCFPFEDEQIAIELKTLAEEAECNGDFWLTLFIVSQIDKFGDATTMCEIQEWATNKQKELIKYN